MTNIISDFEEIKEIDLQLEFLEKRRKNMIKSLELGFSCGTGEKVKINSVVSMKVEKNLILMINEELRLRRSLLVSRIKGEIEQINNYLNEKDND